MLCQKFPAEHFYNRFVTKNTTSHVCNPLILLIFNKFIQNTLDNSQARFYNRYYKK